SKRDVHRQGRMRQCPPRSDSRAKEKFVSQAEGENEFASDNSSKPAAPNETVNESSGTVDPLAEAVPAVEEEEKVSQVPRVAQLTQTASCQARMSKRSSSRKRKPMNKTSGKGKTAPKSPDKSAGGSTKPMKQKPNSRQESFSMNSSN